MIAVTPHARGSVIPVRAQPGAKRTAVLGVRNGALHVAVTASPERGKANDAIVALLAEVLWCRKSKITMLSGLTSREKAFLVEDMTPAEIQDRLKID